VDHGRHVADAIDHLKGSPEFARGCVRSLEFGHHFAALDLLEELLQGAVKDDPIRIQIRELRHRIPPII
jgi:hypothetical protein